MAEVNPNNSAGMAMPSPQGPVFKVLHAILVKGFLLRGSQMFATLGATVIILMVIVNFVTVTGRHSPWSGSWLAGGLEISELLMSMVTIVGGAWVWYEGAHVRIGILREKASPRRLAILDALSALLFLLWISGSMWGVIRVAGHAEVTLAVRIPIQPFQIIYIVVLAHFSIVLFVSMIQSIIKAVQPVQH